MSQLYLDPRGQGHALEDPIVYYLYVRLSGSLSVTRRYCVKMTARSTVQFALSDSKMCLVL